MNDALPEFSTEVCSRLREAFRNARYDTDGVVDLLGPQAHAALGRGEPEPARRASLDAGALGVLVRLFLLGETEPRDAVAAALAPLSLDAALDVGIVRGADGSGLRAGFDIRPHGDEESSWWVVSDLDP
ncbi:SAM-dependent methyltransferase, partial [Klebsiella pneumoniae]